MSSIHPICSGIFDSTTRGARNPACRVDIRIDAYAAGKTLSTMKRDARGSWFG
jgi:hypothetical protein